MARIYKISEKEKENWIFRDSRQVIDNSGFISYRNVICHALHHNLHTCLDDTDCRNLLFELHEKFSNTENYQADNFLELYFVEKDKAFLVDKTGGCFPLLFGGDDHRLYALKKSLENIKREWDNIYRVISENEEAPWNKYIEKKLEEFYDPLPKKE